MICTIGLNNFKHCNIIYYTGYIILSILYGIILYYTGHISQVGNIVISQQKSPGFYAARLIEDTECVFFAMDCRNIQGANLFCVAG